jgi:hypothetical protein
MRTMSMKIFKQLNDQVSTIWYDKEN